MQKSKFRKILCKGNWKKACKLIEKINNNLYVMKKWYNTWSKSKKEKFLKIAKDHQDADRFIQGSWLEDEKINWKFKGCFYWCMTQTYDDTLEEAVKVMCLPAWIIHVSEKIFEGLPQKEAIKFPLQLLEVIPINTDTYQMWKDWSYKLLMDKEHWNIKYCGDNTDNVIREVANLFTGNITEYAAESASNSATRSACSSTDSAAEYSFRSAAWSADSAAISIEYNDSAAEYSARAAAHSTEYTAESASRSAAISTDGSAALDAEYKHYQWLRDTLINLLKN